MLTAASGVHCLFWAMHSVSLVRPARLQSHLRKAWSKRPAVRKLCWLQSEQFLEPGVRQSRRCQITGSALHTMLLLVLGWAYGRSASYDSLRLPALSSSGQRKHLRAMGREPGRGSSHA